jgi:outer membrane protein assembly factor BamB
LEDAATGKTLWQAEAGVHFASPVRVHVGETAAVLTACGDVFRLGDGKALATKIWPSEGLPLETCCSPVYADELLYALVDGRFTVLDAADGKTVYKQALFKGKCYSSVALAGPYLYASNNEGETVVIRPGREYQEVARNTLEPFTSSLVFSGTRLYIRGQTHLYCIGTR